MLTEGGRQTVEIKVNFIKSLNVKQTVSEQVWGENRVVVTTAELKTGVKQKNAVI